MCVLSHQCHAENAQPNEARRRPGPGAPSPRSATGDAVYQKPEKARRAHDGLPAYLSTRPPVVRFPAAPPHGPGTALGHGSLPINA